MGSQDVYSIDTYEQNYADIAAALEQAAEDRAPITVTTCSGIVTTYLPVRIDTEKES